MYQVELQFNEGIEPCFNTFHCASLPFTTLRAGSGCRDFFIPARGAKLRWQCGITGYDKTINVIRFHHFIDS